MTDLSDDPFIEDDDAENRAACCDGSGEDLVAHKPKVDRVEQTTHQSSRKGKDIDGIVVHYTTSRKIEGTIAWFKNAPPGKRASAHYIIGQDGALVQMVPDANAAWHAGVGDWNSRSIGIEHVAAAGDKIRPAQSAKSAALIRWLMEEYDIVRKRVVPHKCLKATDCCGDLFKEFGAGRNATCDEQKEALDAWLTANGLN